MNSNSYTKLAQMQLGAVNITVYSLSPVSAARTVRSSDWQSSPMTTSTASRLASSRPPEQHLHEIDPVITATHFATNRSTCLLQNQLDAAMAIAMSFQLALATSRVHYEIKGLLNL